MEHTIARRALDVLVFRANRLLNRAKLSQREKQHLSRSPHKIAPTSGGTLTSRYKSRELSPLFANRWIGARIRGAGQAMGYPWRANSGFSAMQKSAMAAMSLTALSEGRAIVKDSPLFTHSRAMLVFLT